MPSSLHAVCLSGVLLSVQCCADEELLCANARVTGLRLSGQQLRGSLPEAIGHLGALRSLKTSGNFRLVEILLPCVALDLLNVCLCLMLDFP